ncbi:helix-turn-helix domain-containing protein [Flavobacterium alkalisoli]|uniref:Helix-turn-helix domain-containing protein n=1 Tax=Flavobacterium alkalisoli TaxID=2602769 RepID=A0A5B9FRR3_9FLAO|nr:helix-turn-helix domain-containing protein [Flavobacterium alkalisoli]QEE48776.1 helix-turn-helix domain-containing protein [Flavobacterium alkalisoli]
METIGKRIAEIRKQKGLTQEEVAEIARINLRTLQRIEKEETEPRGNSLKGICEALEINIEDLVDYGKTEDRTYLVYMHLSVMSSVVIPLGNIILPLILWLNKRDRIVSVAGQGKNILNFQIFWTVCFYLLIFAFAFCKIMHYPFNPFLFVGLLIGVGTFNFLYPVYAAVRVSRGSVKNFWPAPIKFIK